jgi:hypothetical protein
VIVGACNTSIGSSPIDVNVYGKANVSGSTVNFDVSAKFFNAVTGAIITSRCMLVKMVLCAPNNNMMVPFKTIKYTTMF